MKTCAGGELGVFEVVFGDRNCFKKIAPGFCYISLELSVGGSRSLIDSIEYSHCLRRFVLMDIAPPLQTFTNPQMGLHDESTVMNW